MAPCIIMARPIFLPSRRDKRRGNSRIGAVAYRPYQPAAETDKTFRWLWRVAIGSHVPYLSPHTISLDMGKHSQTARMSTGGGAPLKKIIKKPLKPLVAPPRPKMRPPPNMKLLHYGEFKMTVVQTVDLHHHRSLAASHFGSEDIVALGVHAR